MIIEYTRYQIPAERSADFLDAWNRAIEPMRLSGHVYSCEVSQSLGTTNFWTVRTEWDSYSGHVEGFRRGRQFEVYRQVLAPFDEYLIEDGHYEQRMEFGGTLTLSA